MKKILVAYSYSDLYYDASTPELLDKACRDILRDRLGKGWYTPDDLALQPIRELLDVSGVTDTRMRQLVEQENEAIAKKNVEIKRANRQILEEAGLYNDVVKCLASDIRLSKRGDPWSYVLLRSRTDAEYERVEVKELDEPEEVDKAEFVKMAENPEYVIQKQQG